VSREIERERTMHEPQSTRARAKEREREEMNRWNSKTRHFERQHVLRTPPAQILPNEQEGERHKKKKKREKSVGAGF
jgi:hypothetical protein